MFLIPAQIVPEIVNVLPSPTVQGAFQWDYSLVSTPYVLLTNSGDHAAFVTLVDVSGGLITANAPIGWVYSIQNTGLVNPNTLVPDDPLIPNLTWLYVGTSPITGPINLSGFSITAKSSFAQPAWVVEQCLSAKPTIRAAFQDFGQYIAPTQAPEPWSFMMLGVGLILIGVCHKISSLQNFFYRITRSCRKGA